MPSTLPTVQVRLEPDTFEALRELALAEDRSLSNMVARLIREALEQREASS